MTLKDYFKKKDKINWNVQFAVKPQYWIMWRVDYVNGTGESYWIGPHTDREYMIKVAEKFKNELIIWEPELGEFIDFHLPETYEQFSVWVTSKNPEEER